MNPNSISHRLFVAALSPAKSLPAKRPVRRGKISAKPNVVPAAPAVGDLAAQFNPWSWSGWQHPTI